MTKYYNIAQNHDRNSEIAKKKQQRVIWVAFSHKKCMYNILEQNFTNFTYYSLFFQKSHKSALFISITLCFGRIILLKINNVRALLEKHILCILLSLFFNLP